MSTSKYCLLYLKNVPHTSIRFLSKSSHCGDTVTVLLPPATALQLNQVSVFFSCYHNLENEYSERMTFCGWKVYSALFLHCGRYWISDLYSLKLKYLLQKLCVI